MSEVASIFDGSKFGEYLALVKIALAMSEVLMLFSSIRVPASNIHQYLIALHIHLL